MGGDAYINTIKNLGGDPTNPFQIFPEVKELYAKRAEELKKIVAEKYAAKAEWTKANPELAAKLELWFSGKAPKVNWNAIEQKAGDATRSASAKVLGVLATEVENMIVSSADLSNSDKTDGFLKKTHAFTKDDFTGAFSASRCFRINHGLLLPRYGTSRRRDCCMCYFLRILRLYETRRTYGCLDGTSRQVHLDTRRIPCR